MRELFDRRWVRGRMLIWCRGGISIDRVVWCLFWRWNFLFAFNFSFYKLTLLNLFETGVILFCNYFKDVDFEVGSSPLALIEGVCLSVPLVLEASEDWGPAVWHLLLTLPVTRHFLSPFSTIALAAGEDFSGNGSRELDPTPVAGMPIIGMAEFKDTIRGDIRQPGSDFQMPSSNVRKSRGGQQVCLRLVKWLATSGSLLPESWVWKGRLFCPT